MSNTTAQWTALTAADGHTFKAWTAPAQGRLRGAVVVAQEIFGVNSHIRAVTERLAARGFLAIAPDLFSRFAPGVDIGYSQAEIAKGMDYKTQAEALPAPGVLQDVQAAAQWAQAQADCRVGMVGFCWGGLVTWRAAAQLPELSAAVCYYGGGMTKPAERQRQAQCPVLAHFGRHDPIIPLDEVQLFAQTQPQVQVHVYEADHGFNCDQRASYDDASAVQAKDRTLAFFDQYLGQLG